MRSKLFTWLALLILLNIQAQTASTEFTLQAAIDYALKHNPTYLNSEADALQTKYKKNEILGLGLPQINGSLDVKDYISLPTSLLPGQFFGAPPGTFVPVKFGTQYNATAGVSASQLLLSSDYLIGVQAAKQVMLLSEKKHAAHQS
ncbi:MAG: TolC family protein [Bacteroidia bacterium]